MEKRNEGRQEQPYIGTQMRGKFS